MQVSGDDLPQWPAGTGGPAIHGAEVGTVAKYAGDHKSGGLQWPMRVDSGRLPWTAASGGDPHRVWRAWRSPLCVGASRASFTSAPDTPWRSETPAGAT